MLIRHNGLVLEPSDHRVEYHIGKMDIMEFSIEAQVAAYFALKAGKIVLYLNRYDHWYGKRLVHCENLTIGHIKCAV